MTPVLAVGRLDKRLERLQRLFGRGPLCGA